MPIAIEKIVDMLEVAIKDPADRWQALRALMKMNKNKKAAKPTDEKPKAKLGRPRKNGTG